MAKKININDAQAFLGILPAVLAPGPTAIANVASKALTGKSIGQNIAGVAQGKPVPPPKTTKNKTQKKKKDNGAVGVAYDPSQLGQKNMRVGQYSHGGLVSHKSVSACETSMGKRK